MLQRAMLGVLVLIVAFGMLTTGTLNQAQTLTNPFPSASPTAPASSTTVFVPNVFALAQGALLPATPMPDVGWSCGAYPCVDDLDAWNQRLSVSAGYAFAYRGRFSEGQVQQMVLGPEGAIYATVWRDGVPNGAVYALDADGSTRRVSGDFIAPLGLAFAPDYSALYLSARTTPEQGGTLARILPDGSHEIIRADLPCCLMAGTGNQVNGLAFGADGALYVGVGSLTDRAESPNPRARAYSDIGTLEAAVLRVDVTTGELTPFASGLRNPYDLSFDSTGQAYASDQGLLTGQGDRVLALEQGAFYGFPYWRLRGCEECPPDLSRTPTTPDLFTLAPYSLPRGILAYTGTQFPANLRDTLFVALWDGTYAPSQVVWIDPRDPRLLVNNPEAPYEPVPFLTGLPRITDIVQASDGSLLVADSVYGMVWQVVYTGIVSAP